ncbi:TIR domain-containing protein [Phthorimaea operculella]|nr:TIR domain-containing protein [Phthorimaea operculella]
MLLGAGNFLIFLVFLSTQSRAQQRIFQSHKGSLYFHNGTLAISCKNPDLMVEDVFTALNETIFANKLAITLCKLPDKPLVETLKAININSTNVNSLSLNYVDIGAVGQKFTKHLKIQNLELKTKRKLFTGSYDFFKPMTDLNLTIRGVELPTIPPNLEILNIFSDASITAWDGCQNLRELVVWRVQSSKQIPDEWHENCSKLESLRIIETTEEVARFLLETIVPKSPNLQLLYIRSCKLRDIPFDKMHSNITHLDLRSNHISELNREQVSQLFGTRARRVWLAGNPISCKCDNARMLEALHINQSQVVDYEALTCSDRRNLRSISVPEICRLVVMSNWEYGLGYVWGLCCSISVFSVVMLVLTRRYGPLVRTLMYSRGYCTSCLRDDIDSDRPYDAFLSFAHGDDEFVLGTLLPKLEDTPNDFHVCIHYRDWAVGEWIPAQIMQSVRQSKRTIIVLSKNFVKSWWGVLEFRYAHASAMAEGRSRLLVLILDDVLNEKLQPELQGYLEYHTFLRCNDPFFWDKLRYAMPHRDVMVVEV